MELADIEITTSMSRLLHTYKCLRFGRCFCYSDEIGACYQASTHRWIRPVLAIKRSHNDKVHQNAIYIFVHGGRVHAKVLWYNKNIATGRTSHVPMRNKMSNRLENRTRSLREVLRCFMKISVWRSFRFSKETPRECWVGLITMIWEAIAGW